MHGHHNAAALLHGDDTVAIFNGDVISGHDLSEQINFHARNQAEVTLHLTRVDDARAYGCVPTETDGRVSAFLEKMDKPVTNTINAGCYLFDRSVIDLIPPHSVVSIEREIFPDLVLQGKKVFGFIDDSYWLDIGTPTALLKGSRDLVAGALGGHASTFVVGKGSLIDPRAQVGGGSALGMNVHVEERAVIEGSIVCEEVRVGQGSHIIDSFIAPGIVIPPDSKIIDSYCAKDGISPL
jgi:mannose-1-phosphate guanylyltransferase